MGIPNRSAKPEYTESNKDRTEQSRTELQVESISPVADFHPFHRWLVTVVLLISSPIPSSSRLFLILR